MQLSICCFLVSMQIVVTFSQEYSCEDRYCFISTNEQNEKILDCFLGEIREGSLQCSFIKQQQKMTLQTKDDSYVNIDKIAPGAFRRLMSGIEVIKFFIFKLRFASLNNNDFNGLTNISDMKLENPKTMDEYTFYSLATTKKFFILTLYCSPENDNNSFKELYLRPIKWRFHSINCNKKRTCEYFTCTPNQQISKITSSNDTVSNNFQVSSDYCTRINSCRSGEIIPKTTPKPAISLMVTSSQTSKSAKSNIINSSKSDNYYDKLMWIVLILTGINSIVIMGILIFLITWWRKLSSSATNKKHTIVLEDEDDTKYLKLNPCV